MVKLLIIADDFTGALDTAVQFASCGAITRVVTDVNYFTGNIDRTIEVLVINAETRHLRPDEAYKVVYRIVEQAHSCEIPYIYKKTDSALRGNIGSELTAVLDASKSLKLHFLPALPRMNRITKKGFHYIDDIPVHLSVFGQDPFEPVMRSSISEIIAGQSQVQVVIIEKGLVADESIKPEIIVYDAETDVALKEIAESLHEKGQLHLMAGCAGLAAVLPELLELSGNTSPVTRSDNNLLVICGSVNPITKAQLDYAEKKGFYRIRLSAEQKLTEGYLDTEQGKLDFEFWKSICLQTERCIIDSNDVEGEEDVLEYAKRLGMNLEEIRLKVSSVLGQIAKNLIAEGLSSTIMLTGGDTLLGFMNQIHISEITPIYEIAPGTVFSYMKLGDKKYEILSKSGGFGDEDSLVSLADNMIKTKTEELIC